MKSNTGILAGCILLILGACNLADNTPEATCMISEPLQEIHWLDSLVQELDTAFDRPATQIIQYEYKGQCVFYIDRCFACDWCTSCADQLIQVFDYDQNVICEFGGIGGINTCPDFEEVAQGPVLLYSR